MENSEVKSTVTPFHRTRLNQPCWSHIECIALVWHGLLILSLLSSLLPDEMHCG